MFLPRPRLNVKEEKKKKKEIPKPNQNKAKKPLQNTKKWEKEAGVVELSDFSHVSPAESYLVTELVRHESVLWGNALPHSSETEGS